MRRLSTFLPTVYAETVVACVVAALLYGSLLGTPPLKWDDDFNVFANPYYRNGSWYRLWATPYFGMFVPVTSTVWAGAFQIANGAVWPFRLLNLLLHVANVA